MFIVFVIIVSAVIKAMHSADITIKNSKKLYVDLHRHLTGSLGFNTYGDLLQQIRHQSISA